MYIPRHHKHRILCIFAEANLHYSFAICRLKQDLRKTHLQFNIQALMMPEGPSLLPTSISIAPNFHRLLSWPWLWQDLSRCIMSYEVAWQHCQDLFRVSKAFKCFAAFDGDLIAFEDFVVFCLLLRCHKFGHPLLGVPCACEENLEPRHVFPLLCATWPRIFIPVLRGWDRKDRLREILAILKSISL